MSSIKDRAALISKEAAVMGKTVYAGETPKNTTLRTDLQKIHTKEDTLDESIKLSCLKD